MRLVPTSVGGRSPRSARPNRWHRGSMPSGATMVTRSEEFCTRERNRRSLAASADSALNLFRARSLALQRGLDGRTDSRQIALQQVIGRPGLHAADGGLFVHRSGDYQERNAGGPLPGQRERAHSVELRQGIVRQNHVRLKTVQLLEELVPRVHPAGDKGDPGPLELVFHELGVHRHVFQNEYAERIWQHQGRAGSVSGRAGYQLSARCLSFRVSLKCVHCRHCKSSANRRATHSFNACDLPHSRRSQSLHQFVTPCFRIRPFRSFHAD